MVLVLLLDFTAVLNVGEGPDVALISSLHALFILQSLRVPERVDCVVSAATARVDARNHHDLGRHRVQKRVSQHHCQF